VPVFTFRGVLVFSWQEQPGGVLTWGFLVALPRCGLHVRLTHAVLGTWSGLLPPPCPSALRLVDPLGAFPALSGVPSCSRSRCGPSSLPCVVVWVFCLWTWWAVFFRLHGGGACVVWLHLWWPLSSPREGGG